MSSNPVALQSMTRAEYQIRVERGYAGPVTAIPDTPGLEGWRSQFPDWRGRNWTYTEDDRGALRLRPVNLARSRSARAA
ncbi:hypothetical protein OH799_01345 [Nocardia sp. NBC_00881]|uniref:hypothetical protein n=1 Tax=Nocardia sp. NBC_00881 TaxID=2975995 RepID=UPI00386A7422|nr:hypothetical protein OH799_01345 [Nocardia sp. NBC_00881]